MAVTTEQTFFTQDAQGRWWIPKDKNAVLEYSIDWSKWLAPIQDSIYQVVIVLPVGTELTVVESGDDGTVTHSKVSGGTTLNSMQQITHRITTAAGRVEDRSIFLKIVER